MTAQAIPAEWPRREAGSVRSTGSVVGVADAPDLLSLATSYTIEAEAWCLDVEAFEARIDAAIEAVDRALVEVGR